MLSFVRFAALTLALVLPAAAHAQLGPPTITDVNATGLTYTIPYLSGCSNYRLNIVEAQDQTGATLQRIDGSYGTITSLRSGTGYRAWSFCYATRETESSVVSVTTPAGAGTTTTTTTTPTPPARPKPTFTVSATTHNTIKATWSAYPDANEYVIEYRVGTSGALAGIGGTSTGTTITGLSPSTTYSLHLVVRKKGVWAEGSDYKTVTTAAAPPPPTPPVVSFKTSTISTLTPKWTAYTGATSFIVEFTNAAGKSVAMGVSVLEATQTFLPWDTELTVKVTPMIGGVAQTAGTTKMRTASGISAPTVPAPVVTGSACSAAAGYACLAWPAVANATKYKISILRTSTMGTYIEGQEETTALTYSRNVGRGATQSYVVQACTASGCGAYSPVRTVTAN